MEEDSSQRAPEAAPRTQAAENVRVTAEEDAQRAEAGELEAVTFELVERRENQPRKSLTAVRQTLKKALADLRKWEIKLAALQEEEWRAQKAAAAYAAAKRARLAEDRAQQEAAARVASKKGAAVDHRKKKQ